MNRALLVATLSSGALLGLPGCSANGTVSGGEPLFDAAPPIVEVPQRDGGSGSTFKELYADFFGPGSPAFGGCAGDGNCHGAPDKPGALASDYVCAAKDDCYASMVGPSSHLVVPGTAPEQTRLYFVLRKQTGGGIMPMRPPTFVFSPQEVKRITDWIAAGAKND